MTEEQLRDVLARVVPEAPDSVADPAPVVRAARVRRRAQVVGSAGVVALVAVAGVVGGRALVDDPGPQVADEPAIAADPYATVPCPDVDALPVNGPFPDEVVAVRFCGVSGNGFPASPGAPDALVEGVGSFTGAVAALPAADPARCAAIDVIPTDSRLLLELADGSVASVSAAPCSDVTVGGRAVDATAITDEFVAALNAQRSDFTYEAEWDSDIACDDAPTYSPVRSEREAVVGGVTCTDLSGPPTALGAGSVELLDDAWSDAAPAEHPHNQRRCLLDGTEPYVLVRTDRGDLVRLDESRCDYLILSSWKLGGPAYDVPLVVGDLNGS